MMFPSAAAASRKLRLRIQSEDGGTDQRKAEQRHQQDCRDASHCDNPMVHPSVPVTLPLEPQFPRVVAPAKFIRDAKMYWI
jgi:hypothetical protein